MLEQIVTNTKIVKTDSLTAIDLAKLIEYIGGVDARICVVCDNYRLSVVNKMIDKIKENWQLEVQDRVFPDPKVADIMDMVDAIKDKGINVIIGVGGGSTLDSAKGIAAVLSNGGDLNDYLGPDATKKIEKRDVKLILVPTTVGTGSEVTKVGVYTSYSGRKYTLGHPLLQADIALLVAGFINTLPPAIIASTGFDALSHALETLWNKNATALSDRVATESAVHVLKWIEIAYESASSGKTEGLAEMQEGACMAGIAFNMTGTAAIHAFSFILSEEWHIPHGTACAFTLEDVFQLNLGDETTKQKLINVAKVLFGDKDEEQLVTALLNRILELKKKMSLPSSFGDLNIELSEDKIGELFNKSLNDPKMKNNTIMVDEQIVFDIIKSKI